MTTSPSPITPGRRTHRRAAAGLFAAACSLVLLSTACASSATPAAVPPDLTSSVAGNTSVPVMGASGVCAQDAVVATYQTAYDGAQPLCHGFAGDDGHAGEGLAGAQTTSRVDQVVQWMLLHARAIYSFQPTAAWLAENPHPRDVNGFFHRQSAPAPGGTAMRAYKDFLTPAPGQSGNEHDYALVSVIVSPAAHAEPSHGGGGAAWSSGGVWFIGCLVYHTDNREYLEPCPGWVWTVPVAPALKRRL